MVWHAGLAAAAVLAVAGARPTRERLAALIVPSALLLAWTSVADTPLGDLVTLENEYTALLKLLVAVIVVSRPARRSPGGAPTTARPPGARCA